MDNANPFPRQLWWYTGVVFGAAVSLGVALLFIQGRPALGPLLLFGSLALFARHRAVTTLASGVTVWPGTMILMASVVVFVSTGAVAGAVAVAILNDVYLPHLRRASTRGWVAFNGGTHALAVLAAALVYSALHRTFPDLPAALLPLAAATAAYLVAELSVLIGSFVVELHHIPRELIDGLPRYILQLWPFAMLGFLLGRLYLALGPAVMLLIIVPILIAREMFASYMRVRESHEETVGMLIRALEQKDPYTAGHAERVATYARYIGEELNFMPTRLERLRFAALMHDIGKLVVPNPLLNKPGRLTEEEFARVRIHEKVSVQMLSHIDFLRPIATASHSDHTQYVPDDPDHPIEPYIVMIADAYDAMTSTRAYRKALPQAVAFQELRDKAGVQFHPACVEALIHTLETRGERHGAGFERESAFHNAPVVGVGSAGLGDLLPSEAQ